LILSLVRIPRPFDEKMVKQLIVFCQNALHRSSNRDAVPSLLVSFLSLKGPSSVRQALQLGLPSCLSATLSDKQVSGALLNVVLANVTQLLQPPQDFVAELATDGLLHSIVMLTVHTDTGLSFKALQFVRALSTGVKTVRALMIETGVMVPMLTLLTSQKSNVEVQKLVCGIVANMVLDFVDTKSAIIENTTALKEIVERKKRKKKGRKRFENKGK
jgi:hypothetical protein